MAARSSFRHVSEFLPQLFAFLFSALPEFVCRQPFDGERKNKRDDAGDPELGEQMSAQALYFLLSKPAEIASSSR